MEKKYFNLLLISLIAIIISSVSVKAQVFDLSCAKKTSMEINQNFPAVYKPSKLIIGNKTKFVIKAEPQSHVSLVTSNENAGYPSFYGKKLRLGQTINPHEGIVGEKGVLELEISLPSEKDLIGKILYFEVLVWKKADYSDLKVAKIMGIDGSETNINAVVITEPSKIQSIPNFGPNIPGTGGDLSKAKQIFDRINDTNTDNNSDNYYENEIFSNNQPLILRNLRAPELNKDSDKN